VQAVAEATVVLLDETTDRPAPLNDERLRAGPEFNTAR